MFVGHGYFEHTSKVYKSVAMIMLHDCRVGMRAPHSWIFVKQVEFVFQMKCKLVVED